MKRKNMASKKETGIKAWRCSRCKRLHSTIAKANKCCPPIECLIWKCNMCRAIYDDENWADKCCEE